MEGLSGRSSVEEWLNGTTDVCFCNMLVLTLNSNGPCGSRVWYIPALVGSGGAGAMGWWPLRKVDGPAVAFPSDILGSALFALRLDGCSATHRMGRIGQCR